MTIELAPLPRRARYRMVPVYAATNPVRPSAGGAGTSIDRPGDHWAIEIDVGSLSVECGLEFMVDIVRGRGRKVAVRIPQPGIDAGSIGSPVVDGAGQTGEVLALKGLTPNAVLRKGWFLSVKSDEDRFTYQISGEVAVSAGGLAEVTIWPMLRAPLADEDQVEIAEPWLQGHVTEGGEFDVGRPASVTPDKIVVEERA